MENLTKEQIKEAKKLDLYNRVKIIIDNGYKHIQFGFSGCIKVKKNNNGIFYTIRNGKGNGLDLAQYSDLMDCVSECRDCGWPTEITYK